MASTTNVVLLTVPELIRRYSPQYEVDSRLALTIAFCESTFRQFAKDGTPLRGIVNPDDIGVFQINERWHLVDSKKQGYDIYAVDGNIEYALWLMKHQGLRHWQSSQPCWRNWEVKMNQPLAMLVPQTN